MEEILVRYYRSRNNAGDLVGPYLANVISGKKVIGIGEKFKNPEKKDIYQICGSILQWSSPLEICWSTGFISANRMFSHKPKKICSVRGPLTREKVLKKGIECPEVYGDSGLLLPKFFQPKVKTKWKLGIVPHYIDYRTVLTYKNLRSSHVKIIDITKGLDNVLSNICSCEKIISSSLHGVVFGDAYGIPSYHVMIPHLVKGEVRSRVMGKNYKFADFHASVGRVYEDPIWLTKETTLRQVYDLFKPYKVKIDLEKLYEACPFKE